MAMKVKLNGQHETSITRGCIVKDGKNVDCWLAYTDVPRDIARFKKQGWQERFSNGEGGYQFVSYEESAILIGQGTGRKKRELTDEQRQAIAERFKKLRDVQSS